jgi:hypothetical protein
MLVARTQSLDLSEQFSSDAKLCFDGKLVLSALGFYFNECVESLGLVLVEIGLLFKADYLRGESSGVLEAFESGLD